MKKVLVVDTNKTVREVVVQYLSLKGEANFVTAVLGESMVAFYSDLFGNNGMYRHLHRKLHESVAAVAAQSKDGIRLGRKQFLNFMTCH